MNARAALGGTIFGMVSLAVGTWAWLWLSGYLGAHAWAWALALAFLFGVGLLVQLACMPLVLVYSLLFPSWKTLSRFRARAVFVTVALVALEIGLALAAEHYGRTHRWQQSLTRLGISMGGGLAAGLFWGWVARQTALLLTVLALPAIVPIALWFLVPDRLANTPGVLELACIASFLPYASGLGVAVEHRRRLVTVLAGLSLTGLGLFVGAFGIEPGVQAVLENRVFLVGMAANLGRSVTDFDRDGASNLFGGLDCAPFDRHVGPHMIEVAGNGMDDNCLLGDLSSDAQPMLRRSAPPPWKFRPNIVLVTIDSLRPDRMSIYGYKKKTTPQIEQFFTSGFRFEAAYSGAVSTREGLTTLLTGRSLLELPFYRYTAPLLDPRFPSLAQFLQANGYRTVAVLPRTAIDMIGVRIAGFDAFRIYSERRGAQLATEANRLMLEMLQSENRPTFAWIHYYEPHEPYEKHAEFASISRQPYDQEVAFVDNAFGQLLREIPAQIGPDPTMVVLAADHGEGLGEHGRRFHNRNVYQAETRVPLLMALPGVPGHVMKQPVSTTALYATLLDLLDLSFPSQHPPTVPSLWPLMKGETAETPPVVAAHVHGRMMLRSGRYNILFTPGVRSMEVFDLEQDPGERQNLLGTAPSIVTNMVRKAEEYLEFVAGAAQSRWRRTIMHSALPTAARPLQGQVSPGLDVVGCQVVVAPRTGPLSKMSVRVLVRTFFHRTGSTANSPLAAYDVERRKGRTIREHAGGPILQGRLNVDGFPIGTIFEDVRTFRVYPGQENDEIALVVADREYLFGQVRSLPIWEK